MHVPYAFSRSYDRFERRDSLVYVQVSTGPGPVSRKSCLLIRYIYTFVPALFSNRDMYFGRKLQKKKEKKIVHNTKRPRLIRARARSWARPI